MLEKKAGEDLWPFNQITDIQNRVLSNEIKIHKLAKTLYIYLNSQINMKI